MVSGTHGGKLSEPEQESTLNSRRRALLYQRLIRVVSWNPRGVQLDGYWKFLLASYIAISIAFFLRVMKVKL